MFCLQTVIAQKPFNTIGKFWSVREEVGEKKPLEPANIADSLALSEMEEESPVVPVQLVNPTKIEQPKQLQSMGLLNYPLKQIRVSSVFGWRMHPVYKKMMFHNGIDCRAGNDTVYAVCDGSVKVDWNERSGIFIRILDGLLQVGYAHLSRVFVLPGEPVASGQPIGITGQTGAATGNHLHLTIKFNGACVDPMVLFAALRD